MANDDRPQDDSTVEHTDDTPETDRIPESQPHYAPPAAAPEAKERWASVREPARRHPVGAAVGAAAVGLVIGFLGGTLADAHPMMSLSVGTAAVAQPAAPGPGFWGPEGPGGPGTRRSRRSGVGSGRTGRARLEPGRARRTRWPGPRTRRARRTR